MSGVDKSFSLISKTKLKCIVMCIRGTCSRKILFFKIWYLKRCEEVSNDEKYKDFQCRTLHRPGKLVFTNFSFSEKIYKVQFWFLAFVWQSVVGTKHSCIKELQGVYRYNNFIEKIVCGMWYEKYFRKVWGIILFARGSYDLINLNFSGRGGRGSGMSTPL